MSQGNVDLVRGCFDAFMRGDLDTRQGRGRGGPLDDEEANALADELTLEERTELMALTGQRLAHDKGVREA